MIGTLTLIISVVIMYVAGTFVADNIFRDFKMDSILDMTELMLLTAFTTSIFTAFPFHIFIYHKSVLNTIPIFLAFSVIHFLISGATLVFTSTKFKHSSYYVEKHHVLQILTLVILIILIR